MEILITSKKHGDKTLIIDDDDYQLVSNRHWTLNKSRNTFYLLSQRPKPVIALHRLLMGFPEGLQVDHVNGNGLDNRRSNLRLATNKQNCANQVSPRGRKYKGVYYESSSKKFKAHIRVNNVLKNLGRYRTEEQAALAYNKAAIKYFGEFAKLNTIPS